MGLLRKPATSIPPAYPPQSRETTETVQAYIPEHIYRDIFVHLERGGINHTLSTFIKELHVELSRPESGFTLRSYDPGNEAAVRVALSRLNFGVNPTAPSTGCPAAPSPKPASQSRRRKHDPGSAPDVRPTA